MEDQFLVYLRPFKLDVESPNLFNWRKLEKLRDPSSSLKYNNSSKYWYMAPEQVIRDFSQKPLDFAHDFQVEMGIKLKSQTNEFACDMWSLGCIFAEMFVSLTPVFQAVDAFDRAIRFFEVLSNLRQV